MSGKPRRSYWSPEDDQRLKELREVKQLKWAQIPELLNNGRSARACQTRYNRHVRGK